MRNLKITIEYDGTNYCGWQAQNNARCSIRNRQKKSIQAVIEQSLQKILQEKVKLIVAGRTDAGVHALGQVASFKSKSSIPLERLLVGVNSLLPNDIKIVSIQEESLDFHSRFSAKEKFYRYTVLNRKVSSPFFTRTAYFFPHHLDLSRMRREAKSLLGTHNFTSFCASAGRKKNPLKTIKKASIARKGDFIYFDIIADGFLYNMVRVVVGTLLAFGSGKLKEDSMKKIISAKDRCRAGVTVSAKGLRLMEIKY